MKPIPPASNVLTRGNHGGERAGLEQEEPE
jgi:hypothetical protein